MISLLINFSLFTATLKNFFAKKEKKKETKSFFVLKNQKKTWNNIFVLHRDSRLILSI